MSHKQHGKQGETVQMMFRFSHSNNFQMRKLQEENNISYLLLLRKINLKC